jgi:hypothetical protein
MWVTPRGVIQPAFDLRGPADASPHYSAPPPQPHYSAPPHARVGAFRDETHR